MNIVNLGNGKDTESNLPQVRTYHKVKMISTIQEG